MPVLITDTDALDKMALIEGEQWRADQERNVSDPFGFYAFLEAQKARLPFVEIQPGGLSFLATKTGDAHNCAIYGNQNRYFVRPSGEILFSRNHARKPVLGRRDTYVRLAKKLGFTIY